jgi:2-polyprenyl-3-methyl-5-hydroxy-6-metoxy-1,4-benzoquinol methylase
VADESDANSPDLARLLDTLRDRVEQRRNLGAYPPGLETELDNHFAHLTGDRPASPSFLLDELETALADLQRFSFGRDRIPLESRIPGGAAMHRLVAKGVGRQIQGVFEQAQDQSQRVARALDLMTQVSELLADTYDRRVLQQLDDVQLRLAEEHRQLRGALARVDDVAARVPGAYVETWYSSDAFTTHFRGGTEAVHERYRDLAARFVGCAPVLDIGFGRGEFLELLRELDVDARGIEPDEHLVDRARSIGLQAEVGGAVDYLRELDDGSLGGIAMIQVIEHLSPQHVIDVVQLAADKVRVGGRVVFETVNPMSLYTYAHAFWLDPDHVRPVHPMFLGFLFTQAGFARVERVDRSPVPDDESLDLLPGDDEISKHVNANLERINALLFAPQDYAIVATR